VNALSAFPITRKWPAQHAERIQLYSLPTPNRVKVSIALEETGLPYEPHLVRFDANDQMSPEFLSLNPNNKIPAIIDPNGPGGQPLGLFESGAILQYLAEKTGKLIPADAAGRARVVQWCFAAVSTVGTTLVCLDLVGMFDPGKAAARLHAELPKLAGRWLEDVERRLAGREWIACADFTVADIMMACVLRGIRKTDLMEPFPAVKAYYERCLARPAWQRTLALYAERLGAKVDDIR